MVYRPPDASHPLGYRQAPHGRPDPDPTRRATLDCRLRARHPPRAGLSGYCLERAHPSGARAPPPVGLCPVGAGHSQRSAPPDAWIAIPARALISQETFAAAQTRLVRKRQLAGRQNTAQEYVLRGLVRCGQGPRSCLGRTVPPGSPDDVCRGLELMRCGRHKSDRGTVRFAPARALDELVGQELARLLPEPALSTHALARAHGGEGLPQALQARRKTLREALAPLERQQARVLEA